MQTRLRLLKGATALLYLGALLAGLAGQGWGAVSLFVAVFVLWSVILRPHLWPGTLRDLGQADAVVALAALVASQALLVIVCFAVGRGIGGVMGLRPALPPGLPLALSFLAVPLSRLIWNPRVMAQNVGFDPLRDQAGDEVARMVAEVVALPDDVTEAEVQHLLAAIAVQGSPAVIRTALAAGTGRAARLAMVLHATDPAVGLALAGRGYQAQALAAARGDAALLALFARRCAAAGIPAEAGSLAG